MANIGSMNVSIYIIKPEIRKDAEGFATPIDHILASVRAYRESRNTTARWEKIIKNAAFAGVTVIFKFRKIPNVTVDATMFILADGERYNIVNVENVAGRGRYCEVLAAKVAGSAS